MPYVVSTWRASWWGASKNRRLRAADFKARFDQVVLAGILAEPTTRVLIGCDQSDPDTILAWIAYDPAIPTVHFAYTREAHPATGECLRRRGLFGVLMTAIGVREGGGLAYTMRPQEFRRHTAQGSRWRPIANHMEPDLLDAARRQRVAVSYVPVEKWLGERR